MLGCWSSGFSPIPSFGAGFSTWNGLTSGANSISPMKKAPIVIITAVAQGTISRSLWRVE